MTITQPQFFTRPEASGTHTGSPFTFTAPCPPHGIDTTWTAFPSHSLPTICPEWHDPRSRGWARIRDLLRGYL